MTAALLALLLCAPPGERTLKSLEVFPAEIELSTSRDRQSIIVLATYSDGVTRDVTDESEFALADGRVERKGNVLLPKSDGETAVTIRHGGRELRVPVKVSKASDDRPVSFKLDVMPVFMRAGCNTGACHGAARGKDGFRLSLFGFDPDGDWFRLTREVPGRRISVALPKECLLVEKAVGSVQHTGGERFKPGTELYDTLVRWLEAGAPSDPAGLPTPVSLEILPRRIVLEGDGAAQRMTVRAKYSDGSDRDVTSLALFMSNNEVSAKIDDAARVTAGQRGEAYVFARFATFTVGTQVIVIPKAAVATAVDPAETAGLDAFVQRKLGDLRIAPSGLADDASFLRRASIDLTGVLPEAAEVEQFLADRAPDKRERLVDRLIARKEFTDLWTMRWAELLQIRSDNQGRMSAKSTLLYFNWLQDQVAKNVPADAMFREVIAATGGTFGNPASNFYQVETDTLKISENVAQVFMGMRIQCAQCHNHPFDRWTMDDYYGFAAFFSQIGRKGAEDPREQIIFNRGSGDVKHPLGGRVMAPQFLGGGVPDLKGRDRRAVLADWLTSSENPWFARNLANLVWSHFFGQGIVEPVDDVRVSNPPSNPELLEELARRLVEYKYDLRKLVRDICTSRAYQRSTRPNETNALDTRNFAKMEVRRIRAEVLLDSISQVTGTKNKFRGLPLGARAVEIADGNTTSYFLRTFGRASRETVCSCEVKMEPNLSQALHLLNGDTVNDRIQQGAVVKKLLDSGKTAAQVLDDLYLRTLGRKPTDKELDNLKPAISAKERAVAQQELEDVFWALLNSNEFIFNH